jgi:uncharacterized membrane protein/protein-disulfide isomerase
MNLLTKILEPRTNAPEITLTFANLLDVKLSASTIEKDLEAHPDYPSLLSVSDVLNNYGIENIGIKLELEKFKEIPTPFITQLKGKNSNIDFFTVVTSLNNDQVNFLDPEKYKWTKLPYSDFWKRCSGIILLAEAGENAGEKEYFKKVKTEKRKKVSQTAISIAIPLIVLLASIACFKHHTSNALLAVIFSFLTLAGCIAGVLLILYEVDQHNPLLRQICSGGKKINCGAILQSKAAKIAGISWSTIGLSYFAGVLLLLLFGGLTNPGILFLTAWINVAAVPYVIFSIYYQWRIAKQWCILCLAVQATLVLQFTIAFLGGWHALINIESITSELVIQTLTAFTIPFLTIVILLPALKKAKESKHVNIELQKLKHNPQIFEALLHKQKQVTLSTKGMGITLGNNNAPYKLIKVCNPYCGPCADAHAPIEDLLHNNPDVQVQVLFTATNDDNDARTPPVKHLLAIAGTNQESITKQALDDWYMAEKKDYETFAAKYPMSGELQHQDAKIEAMKQWCHDVKIEFTPTFFVALPYGEENKLYQLPNMYTVADLKYFFAV